MQLRMLMIMIVVGVFAFGWTIGDRNAFAIEFLYGVIHIFNFKC